MRVCFQFVTRSRGVIDTEPEDADSIEAATAQAKTWMDLKGETISFGTFDGGGAVVRTDDIEHIAVMPAKQMAGLWGVTTEDNPTAVGGPETESIRKQTGYIPNRNEQR